MKYSANNTHRVNDEIARATYAVLKDRDVTQMSIYGLKAVTQWADELVFIAEMSDDYSVTRRELAAIDEYVRPAVEELNRRRAA